MPPLNHTLTIGLKLSCDSVARQVDLFPVDFEDMPPKIVHYEIHYVHLINTNSNGFREPVEQFVLNQRHRICLCVCQFAQTIQMQAEECLTQ